MSRQNEKALRALSTLIDAHQGEFDSEEELNALIQEFMEEQNAKGSFAVVSEPKTADDYLELAEEAPSKKKRLEYLNKALELDPDNLDAGSMRALLTAKHPLELIEEFSRLMEKGNRQMKEEGFFSKEYKGHFWGITETRPYMRLRHSYMRTLSMSGLLRRAARECEEMLTLCESDNLGIRYALMHIYALLEDEKPAKKLMKKYHGENETQMILPFSILHFKLGQMDEALDALNCLNRLNKDTKKFLSMVRTGRITDRRIMEMSPLGYRANCIEELVVEATSYPLLFENIPVYFEWAYQTLKKATKK